MQAEEFEEQFDNGASVIPFADLSKADRQNRPKKQGSKTHFIINGQFL